MKKEVRKLCSLTVRKWKVESGKLKVSNALRANVSKFGFSLVELMISLIVISIVTAAFAPVITKKLKTSDITFATGAIEYNFNEDECSDVAKNCTICSGSECLKCASGYYLEDNVCKNCADNCSECTNVTKCTKCKDGFYQSNGKCFSCPENCKTCQSAEKCTDCSFNYFINSSTNLCSSCGDGCSLCDLQKGCTSCPASYTMKDNICTTSCIPNCEICTSDTSCVKCVQGYFYNGTDCQKCTESDSIIALTSTLTMYRYNLGDECGPRIPPDVKVYNSGETISDYYQPVCVKADNRAENLKGCYTNYSISSYGVCYRTQCNWYAGKAASTFLGGTWQLPTQTQASTWIDLWNSNISLRNKMQTCDYYGVFSAGKCEYGQSFVIGGDLRGAYLYQGDCFSGACRKWPHNRDPSTPMCIRLVK